jgi:hypothetical protein
MIFMVIGAVVLAVVVTFLLWFNIATAVCGAIGSYVKEKDTK